MIDHHLSTAPDSRRPLHDALGPDPRRALSDLADRPGAPRFLAEIGFPLDRYGEAISAVADRAGLSTAEIEPVLTVGLRPTPEMDVQ